MCGCNAVAVGVFGVGSVLARDLLTTEGIALLVRVVAEPLYIAP